MNIFFALIFLCINFVASAMNEKEKLRSVTPPQRWVKTKEVFDLELAAIDKREEEHFKKPLVSIKNGHITKIPNCTQKDLLESIPSSIILQHMNEKQFKTLHADAIKYKNFYTHKKLEFIKNQAPRELESNLKNKI